MGSFVMAQTYRVRDWQTRRKKTDWRNDHSHCLSCGYRLRPYDNIPLVSWLVLRGKCRKCRKPIGWPEFLTELGLGLVFLASWLLWPTIFPTDGWMFIPTLAIFLLLITLLAFLFVYDARYKRLPMGAMLLCSVIAAIFVIISKWGVEINMNLVLDYLGALFVLPLLYFLLYKISGEKLVGSGDYLLALPIALVLGSFWLSFVTLFLANFIGSIVMLPMRKRLKAKIPFGPFLIAGFLIAFLAQSVLLPLFTL